MTTAFFFFFFFFYSYSQQFANMLTVKGGSVFLIGVADVSKAAFNLKFLTFTSLQLPSSMLFLLLACSI